MPVELRRSMKVASVRLTDSDGDWVEVGANDDTWLNEYPWLINFTNEEHVYASQRELGEFARGILEMIGEKQ